MHRRIIHIDKEKCNGCALCVNACHEGAIHLVDGKAELMREDYCDGLGDCLPSCPTGAISFEEREALAYDETAVKVHMANRATLQQKATTCAGSMPQAILKQDKALQNWPVQIQLAPLQSKQFHNASLLIAADCCAYAYPKIHDEFINGRVVLIGCTKLDQVSYSEKLAAIIQQNEIQNIHVVRMEVPCCCGMSHAVQRAIELSGKQIPYTETIITINGHILLR